LFDGGYPALRSDLIAKTFEKFPGWLDHRDTNTKSNLLIREYLKEHGLGQAEVVRHTHHFNHAASAYYGLRQNAKDPHLVLTLDGGGDGDCAHVYIATGNQWRLIEKTRMGESVGNIYSCVTHFMGMTPHEHEYKLMGLAAYAKRSYCQEIVDIFESYLDLDPAEPLRFKRKTPEATFNITRRLMRDFKRYRFDNLAGGLQFYTEDLMVRWVREAVRKTGIRKVVAAGGVFMNVKANQLIAELPEIDYFDVFPSCGDETLPFGGVWHAYAGKSPDGGDDIRLDHLFLGPEGDFDLPEAKAKYASQVDFAPLDQPEDEVARLIAKGEIVARCSGRMEFGARALGNRSILADPADYRIVPRINKMIKQRDFWMPFAPIMLYENAAEYIQIPKSLPHDRISPFMMHTFHTTDNREEFAAGVHPYDSTARAQIVTRNNNLELHHLISKFKALNGKAVMLNTSFNLHGYPIVCGACDAIDVLVNSDLTHLVVNGNLITKKSAKKEPLVPAVSNQVMNELRLNEGVAATCPE
jgi:carbamoyltransferase